MTTYDRHGYHIAKQTMVRDTLPKISYSRLPVNLVNPQRKKWNTINLDTVRFIGVDSMLLHANAENKGKPNNIKPFKDKLIDIIEKYSVKNIVFNFNELEFMDSTGIGMIIGRYNQIKKKGGKIILCSLNKQISRIVMLSGLSRICLLKDSEEEAFIYLEACYEK